MSYRYELRSSDRIVATGHVSWEHPLEVGDEIAIGTHKGVVDTVDAVLGSNEKRLVIRVRAEDQAHPVPDPPATFE